ncbi:MAG: helix-turn-helix domain-containing protein [Fusobacteriaceae bacterium]
MKEIKKDEVLLITLKEAASYIGIGINKIYELAKTADFPCVKIGAKKLVIKSELTGYLIKKRGKVI